MGDRLPGPHTDFMHVDNQLLGVAPAARSRPAVRWDALESYADYLTIGALLAGLVAIGLLLGQFTSFFSIDGDIKYLSAWSIAHHWNNAAIAYPFGRVDPAGHYVLPLTAWVHGHDYAGYSLPFEYLTAFCLAIFGNAGLVVPPVLGTGLLLLVQLQMATLLGIRGRRTLLLIATVALHTGTLLLRDFLGAQPGGRTRAGWGSTPTPADLHATTVHAEKLRSPGVRRRGDWARKVQRQSRRTTRFVAGSGRGLPICGRRHDAARDDHRCGCQHCCARASCFPAGGSSWRSAPHLW